MKKIRPDKYEKNVKRIDLIKDIKRVAKLHENNKVSFPIYSIKGRYSAARIIKEFGIWSEAVRQAGLQPINIIDKNEVLNDIKMVAEKIAPKQLTCLMYNEIGKYTRACVNYHYGSWNNALIKVGLNYRRSKYPRNNMESEQDLLGDLKRVAGLKSAHESIITCYKLHGKHSISTYYYWYGNWKNALEKAGLTSVNKRIKAG